MNKKTYSKITLNDKLHELNQDTTKQISRRDDSVNDQNTKTKIENRIKYKQRRLLHQFKNRTRQTN